MLLAERFDMQAQDVVFVDYGRHLAMESCDQPAVADRFSMLASASIWNAIVTGVPKETHMYQPGPEVEEDDIDLR